MQITLDLPYDSTTLTPAEVVEQYYNCRGIYSLKDGEEISARLCGEDVEAEVINERGEVVLADFICFDDIRDAFTLADYYAWGQDEDENDVLVCFGGR